MPDELHLLFRLARELRYRDLPELVGRRIRVDSLAHVRDALLVLAEPLGAGAWTPHER